MEKGIRWSYKAENLNFEKWVRGRELLIVSAPVTQRKNFDLYQTIKKAIELNMSCALLLVGKNYVTEIDEEVKGSKKAVKVLGGEIEDVVKFELPGTDIGRSFVKIHKVKNTAKKYPRKAGMPSREPIV